MAILDCATNDSGNQFATNNLCLKNHSLKPFNHHLFRTFGTCHVQTLYQLTFKINSEEEKNK